MDPNAQFPAPAVNPIANDDHHSHTNDLTFISIHDLSPEARILYSSDSIVDVLGYTPDEVVDKSVWDFFPPEELPYAKRYHQKGIAMDKAAMLAYCRVKDSRGEWIGCECCFTIVYDVMIVCTSIYVTGSTSRKRAMEAPLIRRIFSSSPHDPRYHMLSHISHKFRQNNKPDSHEPRAALFLNRFTRTLTIMYATSGIEDILGISADTMRGKSFYYCIAENCLQDAIKCLETAKGNNSIAYLRFWFRDPRSDDETVTNGTSTSADDSDEEMTTDTSVDQEMTGGVHLGEDGENSRDTSSGSRALQSESSMEIDQSNPDPQSRTSSGDSGDSGDSINPRDTYEAIFGEPAHNPRSSSASSAAPTPPENGSRNIPSPDTPIEIEAVISCASDGLVVCLRRARPMIPPPTHRPTRPMYENGLFAVPWAENPMIPSPESRPAQPYSSNFNQPHAPQNAYRQSKVGGPSSQDFMSVIREQAIFAWALTGINGTLHKYGSGIPMGESIPQPLKIWKNDDSSTDGSVKDINDKRTDSASSGVDGLTKPDSYSPTSKAFGNDHRKLFGDPGISNHRPSGTYKGNGYDPSRS